MVLDAVTLRLPRGLRLRGSLIVLALGGLLASAASGEILFLRDGRQMEIKGNYVREGDRVIITMPSGSKAFLDAAEVDFEKTDEVNASGQGGARTLEGVGAQQDEAPPPPPDTSSLGDVIASRQRGLSLPEPRRRDEPSEVEIPRTTAGFIDLMAAPRRGYTDSEVTSELLRYLKGQGVEEVKLFQGTAADRPFLEIVANSEASVFKVLKDTANALVQLHERFPTKVAALELLLITDAQVRAGQFLMTPELASELVGGRMDGPTFFLRHVQF